MEDAIFQIRLLILAGCLWSLGILLAGWALVKADALKRLIRRWTGLSVFDRVFCTLSVCFIVLTGATKGWSISFDGGIKQNSVQPSVVTNSTVEIHWMRDSSGGVYVPETATVYIDYKILNDTNATWQSLGSTTVGEWQYSTILANATNYTYNVWAYYIPPEPVHTNGVWVYKTLKDRRDCHPIPLRARIEVDGKAIATPKGKRKDDEP